MLNSGRSKSQIFFSVTLSSKRYQDLEQIPKEAEASLATPWRGTSHP